MPDKKLTDSEVVKEKIKAIYPHIKVSVVDDKPYYCICWYGIENKEMNIGFGSFNFEYVCKWLQENFEVVENDFADLINRLQAENEGLTEEKDNLKSLLDDSQKRYFEISNLCHRYRNKAKTAKAEAYKEFAERLDKEIEQALDNNYKVRQERIAHYESQGKMYTLELGGYGGARPNISKKFYL